MVKDCTTCDNFDIETVYGVCCIHGALGDVVEDCKDYENKSSFLFKQYDRTYKNFDKCMACIEDIVLIAQKQENYEIGKRIEQLLNELEVIKEQTDEK